MKELKFSIIDLCIVIVINFIVTLLIITVLLKINNDLALQIQGCNIYVRDFFSFFYVLLYVILHVPFVTSFLNVLLITIN